MDQIREWSAIASSSLNELFTAIASLLPRLLGALLLFFVGWLLARLLRSLTHKLIDVVDKLLQRFSLSSTREYARLRKTSAILLSGFVFWVVIIVFLGASASVLQLEIFTRWFDALILFLPKLLAGSVIMFSGIIFGSAVRSIVSNAASTARFHQSELLGRIVQITVVVSATVIGVGQFGIDISFLTDLVIVSLAVVLGSFALGIGLATPTHISSLISAHSIRRNYHEGDEIKIGEHHGYILAITQNSVVLETVDGETSLPAKLFADLPATKILQKETHE